MSQETLQKLRLLVPGILLFILIPPLFLKTLDVPSFLKTFASLQVLSDSAAAIVLGSLYIILDIRRFAWRKPVNLINDNIKDFLLIACDQDPAVSAAAARLREGRTLMNVFYRFIDRDASLQEKAKRVRFNGLLWSSVADLITIAALGILAYLVAFAVSQRTYQLALAGVLTLVLVIGRFLLMPAVTQRHMQLSNDQLEFMRQNYRTEVCGEIARLASEF